jgi:hypothetical protein
LKPNKGGNNVESYSDAIVRIFSAMALVIILLQLFNTKGGRWHIAFGVLGGGIVLALFVAVTYRGIAQWGQPHGALYPVHLALGTAFFISYAFACYFGIRARTDIFAIRNHRIAAWSAVLTIFSSLVAGITSAVSAR